MDQIRESNIDNGTNSGLYGEQMLATGYKKLNSIVLSFTCFIVVLEYLYFATQHLRWWNYVCNGLLVFQ